MVSLAQLWLPVLLSAVGVFIASSILHMLLKFWHMPDYRGFPNEDEIGAAIRRGKPAAGMYLLPHCGMEDRNDPEVEEKFRVGPVGLVILRPSGKPAIGRSLVLWFVFCLVVSIFCALAATMALAGNDGHRVFDVTALAALMAYAAGPFMHAVWWAHPWSSVFKDVVDGAIYAVLTGIAFMFMWPVS